MLSEFRRLVTSFLIALFIRIYYSGVQSFSVFPYKQLSPLQTSNFCTAGKNFPRRYPSHTRTMASSNDSSETRREMEDDSLTQPAKELIVQRDDSNSGSTSTSRKRKKETANAKTSPSQHSPARTKAAYGKAVSVGKTKEPGSRDIDAISVAAAVPSCYCNLPAYQQTVKKEGPNQGRKFWTCGIPWRSNDNAEGRCNFFQWQEDNMLAVTHSDNPPRSATSASSTVTTVPNSIGNNSEAAGGGGGDSADVALAIKLLTFNVAEFQPHCLAPTGFDPRAAFLEELKLHSPDILALQELPHGHCSFAGYQSVGTTASHCGMVGLFIRNGFLQDTNAVSVTRVWPATITNMEAMAGDTVPAVLACISWGNGRDVIVGSCHLEPYKEGKKVRAAQLRAIAKVTTGLPTYDNKPTSMILAGDMNMRQAEDAAVEKLLGANWEDAWKQAGSKRQEAYTWDSTINHYHGLDAFQFHCRFDRIYLRNVMNVQSFQLMANKPMRTSTNRNGGKSAGPSSNTTDPCYYLSDHFGIVTTVAIAQE